MITASMLPSFLYSHPASAYAPPKLSNHVLGQKGNNQPIFFSIIAHCLFFAIENAEKKHTKCIGNSWPFVIETPVSITRGHGFPAPGHTPEKTGMQKKEQLPIQQLLFNVFNCLRL